LFDKLLPVPILNLLVRRIDAVAAWKPLAAVDPARIGRGLSPSRRNVAYTLVWAGVFLALSATQGVGDRHPGQYLPFWTDACLARSDRACAYVTVLERIYCNDGSGWACNELGIAEAGMSGPPTSFRRGCDRGFAPACENLNRLAPSNPTWARGDPTLADLPIVLRGTKPPLRERDSARLYALGCQQGWKQMCGRS
jgi:hypothetical protein